MNIQKGNRVLVNVAPFIGSWHRSKDSIPCRVLSIKESCVEVATEFPYRELSMWISPGWIEGLAEHDFCPSQADNHEPLYV
ncbi:MAG: hypothetical protein ABSE63_14870 [Thermoguttaceae bacterium]|jgi:hypothetical protein